MNDTLRELPEQQHSWTAKFTTMQTVKNYKPAMNKPGCF